MALTWPAGSSQPATDQHQVLGKSNGADRALSAPKLPFPPVIAGQYGEAFRAVQELGR